MEIGNESEDRSRTAIARFLKECSVLRAFVGVVVGLLRLRLGTHNVSIGNCGRTRGLWSRRWCKQVPHLFGKGINRANLFDVLLFVPVLLRHFDVYAAENVIYRSS